MIPIQPIVLDRLSAFAAAGYSIAGHCYRCERWTAFDLPAVIERHGDREITRFRPRCSVCGERGSIQVRPPMPSFAGYPR